MRKQASTLPLSLFVGLVCLGPGMADGMAQQRHVLSTRLAAPAGEPPVAAVAPGQSIGFGLTLPLRNRAALEALLRDQRDPASPRYRQYISAQQFAAEYSPTQADYDRVLAFARAQGFTVTRTFSNRLLVNVSGSPASINKAFAVRMQVYGRAEATAAKTAETYYAPDVEPTVSDPSVPILSVVGLSTRDLPHPMLVHGNTAARADATGSGAGGTFLGSDMRAAYAPGVALDGAGQSVGLIEFGPYNLSDVTSYFKAANQPLKVPIYNVLLDVDGVCAGTPTTGGCDDGEEVIDIQQAISMAPGLSALIVYEAYGGVDGLTAFAQAASDNVAKQLSLSFGFGGTPATQPGYEQVFMEFAAQGQNLFIASGDGGAFPGTGGYPGNSPNVTDVGGTDLTTAGPGGAWQSETAWIGSGGGWNTQSPIPAYQVSAITGTNAGSTAYRNVPDVSMEANTDNFFCANGGCATGIGGTSLAAPRWAGFLALANEQASGRPVGFLNDTVYALGKTPSYTAAFHDIVVGNNFNTGSPDLFQAVAGYDLTSGWGTPNGQGMLNALAPAPAGGESAANFALTASPATLNLTPGASATTTVALSPEGGFSGAVDLTVTLIGAPAGVTATLGSTTLQGAAQTTLTVSTTDATPGGNLLVAVTGVGGGVSHIAYVSLALPAFSLGIAHSTLFLNQLGSVSDQLTVDAINGFAGNLSLSLSALPPGLSGSFSPQTTATASTLNLSAAVLAPTTSSAPLAVKGTSGATTGTVPALSVAVSAAYGDCGLGTLVDLRPDFNLTAFRTDGTTFTDGGLDGSGYAFSANLLGPSRVLNGIRFVFNLPNIPNAIYGTGQTIALPQGRYTSLQLVGTGINGNQAGQVLTVTYTDGTTTQFTQGFGDWYAPAINVNEAEAVAMRYRDTATGAADNRQFNLYGYTLALDNTKTVRSLTLPKNRAVILLAATLSDQDLGSEVNLANLYNVAGIYTDGSTFDAGLDGGGAAYSANQLQDTAAGGEEVVVGSSHFHLAGPNVPDAVYAAGQTIALPVGYYESLKLLGTAVQGDQTAQPVLLHYTDGSTDTVTQSFSDWAGLSGYANESLAIRTAYRDYNDGSQDKQAFNVHLYTLPVPFGKQLKSITLPSNRNVLLLGITLAPYSLIDLETFVCPYFNGGAPAPAQ